MTTQSVVVDFSYQNTELKAVQIKSYFTDKFCLNS